MAPDAVDLTGPSDRRFASLRSLYGGPAYARLRGLRVAVVGLGGVGSWVVEALARCGVARLVLIDFDHVVESNINRQVQALSNTLGAAKGEALRERVRLIHPTCDVRVVDEFVSPDNWPQLLPVAVDGLVDACDQVRAKVALAAWAYGQGVPFVTVGAAGGKRQPQRVEVGDLGAATHDPLLASMRQRLRKAHALPRDAFMGVQAVFSREPMVQGAATPACEAGAPLACQGYGSSVMVTATFGLVAASTLVEAALHARLEGTPMV